MDDQIAMPEKINELLGAGVPAQTEPDAKKIMGTQSACPTHAQCLMIRRAKV